jgi:hypothetical protein
MNVANCYTIIVYVNDSLNSTDSFMSRVWGNDNEHHDVRVFLCPAELLLKLRCVHLGGQAPPV